MKRFKTYILLLSLCVGFVNVLQAAECVQWPADIFKPVENARTKKIAPDYGLYWFKMQGNKEVAAKAYLPPSVEPQFSNGNLNQSTRYETVLEARQARMKWLAKHQFFDASKPTIIFVHGVQAGQTILKRRFDFCYKFPGNEKVFDSLPFWKHWNVAIFYWNQFADVLQKGGADLSALIDPETRIYNSTAKGKMNWVYLDADNHLLSCNLSDKHCMMPPKEPTSGKMLNVSQLAFESYKNAIPVNYHNTVWLAGFSLGNQVAIMLAKDIIEQPQVLQLKQLILLDPYYTPNFLKIDVGNKKVAIAKYDKEQIDKVLGLDPRLAFSFYRSSTLSSGVSGDANLPLQREAAYLRICPVYLDHIPKSDRSKWEHITAAYVYLYSKQFDSAYSIASSDSFKHSYPSANSDAKQIKALMGQTRTCYLDDFSKGCSDVSVGDVCS